MQRLKRELIHIFSRSA